MFTTKLSTETVTFEDLFSQLQGLTSSTNKRYLFYPHNGKLAENIIISPKTILNDSALVISRPIKQHQLIVSDENLGQAIINYVDQFTKQNISLVAGKYVNLIKELAAKYSFTYHLQTSNDFNDDLALLQNSHLEMTRLSFYENDIHSLKLLATKCDQFYSELIAKLTAI